MTSVASSTLGARSTARGTRAAQVLADPRWAALLARDATSDGTFLYSVETTGVYCRPSCAARVPRPEHVAFHADRAAAERAGFRACKRCRPDQPPLAQLEQARMRELCRWIDEAEAAPTLEELGRRAGLSPHHLQRVFKRVVGVSPKAYAAARRAARVRAELDGGSNVTQAIYGAGYGSGGRFYADAPQRLGMTPTQYRAGGARAAIGFAVGSSSLGHVLVGATERGICAILLGDDPGALVEDLRKRFPRARIEPAPSTFESTVRDVVRLVEAPHGGHGLPLDIRGTAFQERVWRALVQIPAGTTLSYTELAKAVGMPSAVRAVAHACAANPLAVAVPCHRVRRSDGDLAGYRWGIERKRELLARESKP